MQFGFRFQILLFTTTVHFSNKTLAYLTYKVYKAYNAFKAFMAFKCLWLNPFQNYHSITSFSVDWPRTKRLVYAPVSILSICAIMLQVIVIQTRWNTKRLTKEFYKQKSCGSSYNPALSVHDNINHHQDNTVISMWTPHWTTVSCHVVEDPMTTGYYCTIFPFCGRGKKQDDKKTKAFYDWAIPQVSQ